MTDRGAPRASSDLPPLLSPPSPQDKKVEASEPEQQSVNGERSRPLSLSLEQKATSKAAPGEKERERRQLT